MMPTCIHSPPLCASFAAEAKNIWDTLAEARRHGIIRDEETVTNDFLLRLQRMHPGEISVFQFNKREERYTGADWEWWLTDGTKWLGLLIQAKILNPRSNKYHSIHHKVGNTRTPQIDLILDQASLKQIEALYFFYNHSTVGIDKLGWNCGSFLPTLNQLGCTIAHAKKVKEVLDRGDAGLPTMKRIMMPLRCLVCCEMLAKPDKSLPAKAHGVAQKLQQGGYAVSGHSIDGRGLRGEPPTYVQRLMNAGLDNRASVINELRKEVGPIGSLVVIKDRDYPSI